MFIISCKDFIIIIEVHYINVLLLCLLFAFPKNSSSHFFEYHKKKNTTLAKSTCVVAKISPHIPTTTT